MDSDCANKNLFECTFAEFLCQNLLGGHLKCLSMLSAGWCNPGFTGVRCETEIDECQSDPCQNNGTCTDGLNGYNCTCVPEFFGQHCENGKGKLISSHISKCFSPWHQGFAFFHASACLYSVNWTAPAAWAAAYPMYYNDFEGYCCVELINGAHYVTDGKVCLGKHKTMDYVIIGCDTMKKSFCQEVANLCPAIIAQHSIAPAQQHKTPQHSKLILKLSVNLSLFL